MAGIVLPYDLPEVAELIYCKTNIGGFFFDAFLRIDHTTKLRITEHPVQTGASISDHAYLEPAEVVMEVGMSDAMEGLVSSQFTGGWSRSVKAYEVLAELQKLRIPLQMTTRLKVYQNMLIETLTVPDDYKTLYSLRCTVTLREIIVAEVKTVQLSAKGQTTGNTQRGEPEPVNPNQSILKQISGLFGGS